MGYSYDQRTQGSHFRNFYARLKKAMSYEQALETLGFPTGSNPSAPEIAKAYKAKAVENHPDRGGNHEKMVEVNVAKDVLDGKQRPTYERAAPTDYAPPPAYSRQPPRPPAKKEEITFEEARSHAGVSTASVEWLFVTDTQRARDNYMGDESSKYDRAWVLYGRDADEHIFVGIENSEYSGLAGAGDGGYDRWSMKVYSYPLETKTSPSWYFGNIAKAISGMKWYSGRFNSKVLDIKGKMPSTLTEEALNKATRSGHAVSIKNMLVNLGEVSGDDPSVANRKIAVELKVETDMGYGDGPKPGFHPGPPTKYNTLDGVYKGDYYKITLVLAGRQFDLDPEDTKKILALKAGGRDFLTAIFGDYGYRGGKKVITRMPKGKVVLLAFVEHLKGLPAPAIELLQRAADQMKG